MEPQRWQEAKDLFRSALDQPPGDRQSFVTSECKGDESLCAEVMRLLSLHDGSTAFLKTPIELIAGGSESAADPLLGRNLSGFRILRRIGAGGMGAVYEAEQDHPRRRAAVKVLRPGFATRAMLRRLEYESEILAKLQHPGIAHVYAAGTFELRDGAQPWFAMELIDGEALHGYVKGHELTVRQKLELLLLVCDAVQHAHQRGVVHRDLKPANILVERDGKPKVLDFGVARTIEADVQATMHTAVGELVGTLSYMSPEQLAGEGSDVDARCDVYALGVIGYELLGGRLPHRPRSSAVTEVIRAIEQDTPPRLGTIDSALRGDIETIFAKALEKDPVRRYQSAADFGADLRRFLNDEPVLARPATALYQFGKFARRNRALVGGVAATMLALILGIVLYARQARLAQIEAARARYEADKATAINNFITNDFLTKLLAVANTRNADSPLPVATMIDEAAQNVSTMFANQPLAEAAVRNEVGSIYYNLSAFEKAAEQFTVALDRWESRLGPDHPDTLKAVNNLGQSMAKLRRAAEAEKLYRRAIDGRRRVLGDDDPYTLVSMNNLAELLRADGRLDEAESIFRQTLAAQRRVHGDLHKNTITTAVNFGSLLVRQGKTDEALALHRQAYEASRKTLGDDHVLTRNAAFRLGQTLHRAGANEEAQIVFGDVVAKAEQAVGASHGETISARRALARAYKAQGKARQATEQLNRALEAVNSRQQPRRDDVEEIKRELESISRTATSTPSP